MSTLFLSCASAEFAELCTLLTRDLQRPNVEVKAHEEIARFVGGGTTLEKLDDYLARCDAVVHLVGEGTGSEVRRAHLDAIVRRYPDLATVLPVVAPLLDADAPWRGSYTQWEAYLALYHDRRVYLYRGTAGATAGFVADDASRRRQAEHWARLATLGRDRLDFTGREALRVAVLNHLLELVAERSEPLRARPSTLWKLQSRPDAVFEGRERVLADLDALWADALADRAGRSRIASLVAIGGAGKTTVASRWKDALLARDGHGGVERYFDWSFYTQGTEGARHEGDATAFVAAALDFFGDAAMADGAAPAWDKGARLATLVAQHRTLLVLDGLEPLQHPPGPQTGELKDDAMRALLAGLQSAGRGLCLLTTRETIADPAVALQWPLDRLGDAAGAAVLRGHGVVGPQAELEAASREVKGHALTLSLMGRYLALAFDPPDVARRDRFAFSAADAATRNGHARRVFAAYERWLGGAPPRRWWQVWRPAAGPPTAERTALAILRLLGLFDRPATPDCLAALCAAPAIPGLTEPLVGIGEPQWNAAVERLRALGLVETVAWEPPVVRGYGERAARVELIAAQEGTTTDLGPPQPFPVATPPFPRRALDAHPLLREHFDARLRELGVATAAHERLFEQLRASVPYWPEGRDGLLPLYQAMVHGCRAGRFREALTAVYHERVRRGSVGRLSSYGTRHLGLYGAELAALASFFAEPWRRLAGELPPDDHGWLLGEVAFRLRALNRHAEAEEPLRASVDMAEARRDWQNAAIRAGNLSELARALGDVPASVAAAVRAAAFSAETGDAFLAMSRRATYASALLAAGREAEARAELAEADALQARRQPHRPALYSLPGFHRSDVLLGDAERAAWRRVLGDRAAPDAVLLDTLDAIERRTDETLAWAAEAGLTPLSFGLDRLTLGRVHLLRGVLLDDAAALGRATAALDEALATLRQANSSEHLPLALLPDAWASAMVGEWERARQRLDEAMALATRGGDRARGWVGGMRLHLVDALLHRARLFGVRPSPYPWDGRTRSSDLDEAAHLVEVCGYHRRDAELTAARAALR